MIISSGMVDAVIGPGIVMSNKLSEFLTEYFSQEKVSTLSSFNFIRKMLFLAEGTSLFPCQRKNEILITG